jgi:D-alanine transaminase/branched-chain amino acid aminotransferase
MEYSYLNGQIVPLQEANLNITDLGLLRGYGIFDFFKAVNGQTVFMEDHLDRFERSAKLMHLELPYSREQLRSAILTLVQLNPQPLLGIKLILTGGYSPDGYTPTTPNVAILAKPFKFADMTKGMKLMSIEYLRELAEVKSLNYTVPIWHLPQMRAMGADDYLYHKDGEVSELSRSNVFIVKNDKIITPKFGVLYGITRKRILIFAQKHFEIEERPLSLTEFYTADEVFTSGSTKKIVPIIQVNDHEFSGGQTGKITQKLQTLFEEHEQEFGAS